MSRRLFPFLLMLVALPAAAAPRTPPWLHLELGRPRHSAVSAAELAVAPARREALGREGHPFVDLLRRHELTIDAAGKVEDRTTIVRLLTTDEGVREDGNLQVAVRAAAADLFVEEAWVLLADGARR